MQINANFEQSAAKVLSSYSENKDANRYAAKLNFKTFYQQHKTAAKVLPMVGFGLFGLFSISTASFYLAGKIYSMLPIYWAAGFLAVAALLIIEVGKSYLISHFFYRWFYSLVHFDKAKVNIGVGIFTVLLLAASIFMSVSGAKDAALVFADKSIEVKQLGKSKADSINAAAASKIKALEEEAAEINKHKSKRWGGLLSTSENQQILNIQSRIKAIEAVATAAVAAVGLSTNEEEAAAAGKAVSTSESMIVISSCNEAAIVFCGWFLWFFAYKVRQEKEAIKALPADSMQGLNIDIEEDAIGQQEQLKQPIGFKAATVNVATVNVAGNKKLCKKCSIAFSAKHWNAKYCSEDCRIEFWERKTGKKFIKGQKR